jgi:cytochrome P450
MQMTRAPLPPGPKGTFLGGNLADFRRDRLAFMTRCNREFGPVTALRLGPRRIFLLTHPDPIENVLLTNARNFTKHFALRMNPLVLGNGLLTSEGEFWLRQRRLIQPVFLPSRLATYAADMVAATHRLIDTWKPDEERNIVAEMKRLTLDITAGALFGADVTGAASAVNSALQVLQDNFIARFNSLIRPPAWLPTPRNLRFHRAMRHLDGIIFDVIRRRREAKQERNDLLSILLRARDEEGGGRMSDRQLRDEAMTLFLAGHETTALALSWTWFLLATHPEVQTRLAEEVCHLLNGRDPKAEDWPKLTYATQVVQESMRLYPPVYTFGRESIADCELNGFHVPAHTTLLISQWVVHHHPNLYEEPDAFRPERWGEPAVKSLPKFAYFPFGGGPRICIGNTFAMMEMVLALATMVQRSRLTVREGEKVVAQPTFTLRPSSLHGSVALR